MRAISSGLQAASAAIFAGPCFYLGAVHVTDGSADNVMTVWDSPDTTVTNDTEVDYFVGEDTVKTLCHIMKEPVWCAKGISCVLDAADGKYIVYYAH